jgi:hypothetical protein
MPDKRIRFSDHVKPLKVLLQNYLLTGVNINGDCTKLQKDYDIDFDRSKVVDLATFAKSNAILLSGAPRSLTDLLRIVCGFSMEKDLSCQRSNRWHTHPLPQEFLQYTLVDIYATSMVAASICTTEKTSLSRISTQHCLYQTRKLLFIPKRATLKWLKLFISTRSSVFLRILSRSLLKQELLSELPIFLSAAGLFQLP